MELSTNVENQPAREQTPAPSRAKQIVSMCLSIAGLGMVTVGGIGLSSFLGGGSVSFSAEALALSIVGYVMSCKGLKTGADSQFLRLGKSLGLAGIIVSSVALALTVLFLLIYLCAYLGLFAAGITEGITQYI